MFSPTCPLHVPDLLLATSLTCRISTLQDLLNTLSESHVQHLVYFIKHNILQLREIQLLLLHVVQDPAWSSNQDVQTFTDGRLLRPVGGASVDAGCGQGRTDHLKVLADLDLKEIREVVNSNILILILGHKVV